MELKKDYLQPISEITITHDLMAGGTGSPTLDGPGLDAPSRLYI